VLNHSVFPSFKIFWQHALAGIDNSFGEREQSPQIVTVAVEPAIDFRDRHLADGKLPTLRQQFLHGMSGGAKKSRRAIGRKRGVHRRKLFANRSFRGAVAGVIEIVRVALPPPVTDLHYDERHGRQPLQCDEPWCE